MQLDRDLRCAGFAAAARDPRLSFEGRAHHQRAGRRASPSAPRQSRATFRCWRTRDWCSSRRAGTTRAVRAGSRQPGQHAHRVSPSRSARWPARSSGNHARWRAAARPGPREPPRRISSRRQRRESKRRSRGFRAGQGVLEPVDARRCAAAGPDDVQRRRAAGLFRPHLRDLAARPLGRHAPEIHSRL